MSPRLAASNTYNSHNCNYFHACNNSSNSLPGKKVMTLPQEDLEDRSSATGVHKVATTGSISTEARPN